MVLYNNVGHLRFHFSSPLPNRSKVDCTIRSDCMLWRKQERSLPNTSVSSSLSSIFPPSKRCHVGLEWVFRGKRSEDFRGPQEVTFSSPFSSGSEDENGDDQGDPETGPTYSLPYFPFNCRIIFTSTNCYNGRHCHKSFCVLQRPRTVRLISHCGRPCPRSGDFPHVLHLLTPLNGARFLLALQDPRLWSLHHIAVLTAKPATGSLRIAGIWCRNCTGETLRRWRDEVDV